MQLEIGRNATLHIGRWAWIGHGSKIRVHEGEVSIGAKTVMGQECTISAFQHVSIGRECILADRVMLIDFDHGVTEVDRPIRLQGIYKRDVRVGHNVWIGYGACVLRGVAIGDNSIVGTSSVVTKQVPENAVVAGAAGARDPDARGAELDALGLSESARRAPLRERAARLDRHARRGCARPPRSHARRRRAPRRAFADDPRSAPAHKARRLHGRP